MFCVTTPLVALMVIVYSPGGVVGWPGTAITEGPDPQPVPKSGMITSISNMANAVKTCKNPMRQFCTIFTRLKKIRKIIEETVWAF